MLAASRLQARYRRLRDAIGTGEIGLHCAIGKALKGFCALMRGECRGATETHATGLGALPAFACTGTNQLALKLGQATENREHQPAVRRRGVCPGVFQAAETSFTLANVAKTFNKSRVDCARRSKRVTITTSPGSSRLISLASSARSVFAPETFSLNTLAQPSASSSASCEPRSWPLVETRA